MNYDWTQDYCAAHNQNNKNKIYNIPIVFDEIKIEFKMTKSSKLTPLTYFPTQTFYNTELVHAFLRFGDINQGSFPDFTTVLYDKGDFTQNSYVSGFWDFRRKYD